MRQYLLYFYVCASKWTTVIQWHGETYGACHSQQSAPPQELGDRDGVTPVWDVTSEKKKKNNRSYIITEHFKIWASEKFLLGPPQCPARTWLTQVEMSMRTLHSLCKALTPIPSDCGWEEYKSMDLVLYMFPEYLFGNVSKARITFSSVLNRNMNALWRIWTVRKILLPFHPVPSHQFAGNKALRDLLAHSLNAL